MLEGFNIIEQHHHNTDAFIPFSEREKSDALSSPRGSMVQNTWMCTLTNIKTEKKVAEIQNVPSWSASF